MHVQAYKIATNSIPNSQLFLNKAVAIPSLAHVQHALAGTMKPEGIGASSGRIKPDDFVASVGATMFFSESPGALAATAKCACEYTHSALTHSPD